MENNIQKTSLSIIYERSIHAKARTMTINPTRFIFPSFPQVVPRRLKDVCQWNIASPLWISSHP